MGNPDSCTSFCVPLGYDDNKIVLMVRDPWTLFSYWEIRKDVEDNAREKIYQQNLTPSKSILRVYDVSQGEDNLSEKIVFDFELKNWAANWYVHTGDPGRKWMVEIGIVCTTGEFFCLARSNVVEAPNYGMSDIYDEEWMCPEDIYYKMFAACSGLGTSSMEMKEMIERHLKEWISSGGISSGAFGSASFHLLEGKKRNNG